MARIKRSWDPLYGKITFTEYESGLISLPEVQRLRYVRMCNINSLLVTGASEISRFEHTLGVLRLAQEWCDNAPVSASVKKDMLAAAVLHDMKTGPFGHSLQYVLEDNETDDEKFKHDDISHNKESYHQNLTAMRGFKGRLFSSNNYLKSNWDSVSELISGRSKYGPVISGTMDIDNIDNVIRLAYHVGVAKKEDSELALSLARNMSVHENGELSYPVSSIPDIESWLKIRRELYRLLLLDWAEFSAKAMLTRAVEIAIENKKIEADSWIYTDLEFLYLLEEACIGEAQEASVLVKRIQVGDLFSPAALLKSPSVERYKFLTGYANKKEFERKLSQRVEDKYRKKIKPLLHVILDWGKTERAVGFVCMDNGAKCVVGEDSKLLLIGIFLPDEGLNERIVEIVNFEALAILEDLSVENIELIMDPMDENGVEMSDHQLGFNL